jgi:hypothetical protein
MRSKAERHSEEAEKAVRDIRRATRRQGVVGKACRQERTGETHRPTILK